jgi:hypothetical protein
VVIDVWLQHPTQRFLQFLADDMFAPLRRWTGAEVPEQAPDISLTIAAMDAAGFGRNVPGRRRSYCPAAPQTPGCELRVR